MQYLILDQYILLKKYQIFWNIQNIIYSMLQSIRNVSIQYTVHIRSCNYYYLQLGNSFIYWILIWQVHKMYLKM